MITKSKAIIPIDAIATRILLIRGQRVILDADLAQLCGVITKQFECLMPVQACVIRHRQIHPQRLFQRLNLRRPNQVRLPIGDDGRTTQRSIRQHCPRAIQHERGINIVDRTQLVDRVDRE